MDPSPKAFSEKNGQIEIIRNIEQKYTQLKTM